MKTDMQNEPNRRIVAAFLSERVPKSHRLEKVVGATTGAVKGEGRR
jgi:hypothetical protein